MRILITEDDLVSRMILIGNLSRFGTCDVAVDGEEAVQAVKLALQQGNPYELICMDIMMPRMDGQQALKAIRELETEHGVTAGLGAKIIMTTALSDYKNVSKAFRSECDAYLIKPIEKKKLLETLEELELTS